MSLFYSAVGTWLSAPWSRSQWTSSSCTCQATQSPSSPSWWSAWWPGDPYRLSCQCLPVGIQYQHRFESLQSHDPSRHSFLPFLLFSAFKLLESSSQQWLQGLVYLIGNLLGSALAIYKCQSMGLLPTHSSDWLAFIEPPQVKDLSFWFTEIVLYFWYSYFPKYIFKKEILFETNFCSIISEVEICKGNRLQSHLDQ